jgi:hypothetical protein
LDDILIALWEDRHIRITAAIVSNVIAKDIIRRYAMPSKQVSKIN